MNKANSRTVADRKNFRKEVLLNKRPKQLAAALPLIRNSGGMV